MPKNTPRPRDFVVTDEWKRTLRFYMVGHKFYRRDETPGFVTTDGPEVKEVSKLVYAMRWLDLCLDHGLSPLDDPGRCTCGQPMVIAHYCPVCDGGA